MARKASALVARLSLPETMPVWDNSPEDRQRMIQEAAYYRYVRRGFVDGQDVDDWLAAEAELGGGLGPERHAAEAVETQEFEVQQSSAHGFRHDEALKRIIRQHPQRGIPQVESIEPIEAPAKE